MDALCARSSWTAASQPPACNLAAGGASFGDKREQCGRVATDGGQRSARARGKQEFRGKVHQSAANQTRTKAADGVRVFFALFQCPRRKSQQSLCRIDASAAHAMRAQVDDCVRCRIQRIVGLHALQRERATGACNDDLRLAWRAALYPLHPPET